MGFILTQQVSQKSGLPQSRQMCQNLESLYSIDMAIVQVELGLSGRVQAHLERNYTEIKRSLPLVPTPSCMLLIQLIKQV